MRIEDVRVADLITPENNIRKHPDKQIEELTRSYEMFGQIRPVVIDENNHIWAGNGFVEAMRRAGVETISAYRVVGLTDDQKKKLMLADNKTYALGSDNLSALDDVMKSLGDFDIPGYDMEVLTELYSFDDEELVGTPEEPVADIAYGTVAPEVAQKIIERAERPAQVAPVAPAPAPQPDEPVQEHEPQKTSVRQYVICPKCGEKIWL